MSWSLWAVAILVVVAATLAGLWYGRRAGNQGQAVSAWIKWGTGACLVVAIGVAILWFVTGRSGGAPSGATDASQNATPVVPVHLGYVRRSQIQETITVYGTVVAQPGETRIVSVPFESRVGRLFVTAGEQVKPGTPLVEIGPSAASRLQLQQAHDAESTAQKELQQVQEEFDQRLATNSQLLAAKQAFQAAHLTLQNLEQQGVGRTTTLTAQSNGIIRQLSVQEGQIAAAGAPLVENALQNRIEVKLGIEPEDVPYVHDGATVELRPVHTDAKAISGRVRLITQQVNPATRLVDVFVALPPNSGLMLEGYVRGEMVTASKLTLVVPREAVLPEQKGYSLFTVENNMAVKHVVHVGLENSKEVEIEGDGLTEGMPVVLSGNYELTSGMAVSPEKNKSP